MLRVVFFWPMFAAVCAVLALLTGCAPSTGSINPNCVADCISAYGDGQSVSDTSSREVLP